MKIDRELYVFDWCAGKVVDTFHILIKIGDFKAPIYDLAHHAPFEISTGPMDCTAAFPVTKAGVKSAFGVDVYDKCNLANMTVSVYTKDLYIKGILVNSGNANPFCVTADNTPKVGYLGPDGELDPGGENYYQFQKTDICWGKVDYAIMNGQMIGVPVGEHLMVIEAFDGCYNASTIYFELK